ncbi:phage distal tail protein [Paenibacillus medicaginis]|uniref:Siphovirus-type tail component C-terminal domain-containing protein n=1 Tax=Paenibacillus medicaginis TaxID=1470560 RepID=A0ABV5C3C7_9BACL
MFNAGGFNSLGFNTGDNAEGNIIDLSAELFGEGALYSRKIEAETDSNSGFNAMLFNTVEDEATFDYVLEFVLDMTIAAELSGSGQVESDFIREYVLTAEEMSGEGNMASADFVREIILEGIPMSGEGSLSAELSRFHTEYIEFTDAFRPGEVITIDSSKFKITRNGKNVSHLYNGDFFDLNLGRNNLTWTDPETGRTVLFRITHRDKYLY